MHDALLFVRLAFFDDSSSSSSSSFSSSLFCLAGGLSDDGVVVGDEVCIESCVTG
jgi:hypothetical protein